MLKQTSPPVSSRPGLHRAYCRSQDPLMIGMNYCHWLWKVHDWCTSGCGAKDSLHLQPLLKQELKFRTPKSHILFRGMDPCLEQSLGPVFLNSPMFMDKTHLCLVWVYSKIASTKSVLQTWVQHWHSSFSIPGTILFIMGPDQNVAKMIQYFTPN